MTFEKGSALRTIEINAFCECKNLRSICLPVGLENVQYGCFSWSGLKKVYIPSSVAVLEDRAFCDCHDLKSVVFQNGSRLRSIGKLCFCHSGLEEFVVPPGLKEIGGEAFWGCKKLKRVVLNEGLEALSDYYNHNYRSSFGVFQGSRIEEITLPSTLKEIGERTFSYDDALRTIYVRSGCSADLSQLDVPDAAKVVRE